jgi:putative ABC transport system permease protein
VTHGDQPVFITGSEVTPEYFHLLGMTLRAGRFFDAFDAEKRPAVAVVNETMARTYWPNENPIGKRMRLSRRSPDWTTVVGVVADARTESLASASVPQVYLSLYQRQGKHLAIFVRGHVETGALARQVGAVIASVNTALPVFGVETLGDTVANWLAVRRFAMELIALFALTALILATLGIYGVISYMVSERRHEIGVRIALGAQRSDVMAMVMRQGVRLAIAGAAIGLVGTLVVARAMARLLVGVSPNDPWTFGVATLVLTTVAVAGCYLPARRAVRVDPISALR